MHDLTRGIVRLGRPRILVLGDLMLDRYLWGEAERVSPEAPVLVLREDLDEVRPGGAANVASFLRGLDAEVVLAGVIGDDADGRTLQRLMREQSIDTDRVLVDAERPTTSKQRIVGRAVHRQPHQIVRIDRESRSLLSAQSFDAVHRKVLAAIPDCDAVLVSDYGKGVCTPELLRSVIEACRHQQVPILIDPSRGGDYQRYARANIVTPNRVAAELVLGQTIQDPATAVASAHQFRGRFQLDAAILTLDRDGLAYATQDASGHVPCRERQVCDVTGAGDMVLAVMGLCVANHMPLVDSLNVANAAAGLEVERFGVEPVTRTEIDQEIERDLARPRGAESLASLLVRVAAYRSAGRSIVFTNGCFDLLHVGHVALLEEAARLGDVLIVAINSDASVRRLKGSERPIIGEHDRARMLAALACVDHVLMFDDDTPHRLLQALRPDVLVKGGTTGHIVGREVVEAYGGSIEQTQTIPGLSTTALVSLLQFHNSITSSQENP